MMTREGRLWARTPAPSLSLWAVDSVQLLLSEGHPATRREALHGPALQSLGEWTGPRAAQLQWPDPACAEEAHPSRWPGSGLRAAVGAATGAGMGPLPPKQVLLVLGP